MRKYILLIIVISISFFSCLNGKKANVTDEYLITLKVVSDNILGLQFKGIEAKGASGIYEDYKKQKIEIVKKSFLGQDYSQEKSDLIELRQKFNELTLDADMLPYVDDVNRENPYISDFENYFVKSFIYSWKKNLEIDLCKLQIIYEN